MRLEYVARFALFALALTFVLGSATAAAFVLVGGREALTFAVNSVECVAAGLRDRGAVGRQL